MIFKPFAMLLMILGLLCFNYGCQKKETIHSSQILTVAAETDPQTLDPRKVRDLGSVTTLHLLYEGLMRTELEGILTPTLAQEITLSEDKTVYTFHLRESKWTDGSPVTAYDFEQTWKSVLDPHFPSPNAYQLYPIWGAKEAKEGTQKLEDVGVHAIDSLTLVVRLREPTPYFLELTSTYFFYPVHSSLREKKEGIVEGDSHFITNGPFMLSEWKLHDEWMAVANPNYWDKEDRRLSGVRFIILDPKIAIQLFQRGELDWAGSPLSTLPTDSLKFLNEKKWLYTTPAAGLYFLRLNTEKFPLDTIKMRQALALALNRGDLVDHVLQGKQTPAFGIIPPSFLAGPPLFNDNDTVFAKRLFAEALSEKSLVLKDFPTLYIQYAVGERNHKIAQVVQAQWKAVFGIDVQLRSSESKIQFEKIRNGDYEVAISSWFADFRDPLSFLDVFKQKHNGTNNTGWEHLEYVALLNASALPENALKRNGLLKQAERLLVNEMPIIPLFFSSYNYLKDKRVQGVYFSSLGYLDFKQAYLEDK